MDQRWGLCDDGHATETSLLQTETEDSVFELLSQWQDPQATSRITLTRSLHVQFLRKGLVGLSRGFVSLDASKPWILFWILQALDLLNEVLTPEEQERAVDTLNRCQDDHKGGFGGGPGQEPHLATTYAAVHALAVVGSDEAFDCIDRKKLYSWMMSLKQPNGSFIMHHGGEVDVRASYCVASVCRLLNLLTPSLTDNMGSFIASCQTYEGGIGAFPGVEGHGGYTFCGIAAIEILQETDLLNMRTLTHWAVSRQMELEGGFQGRTNKLVDGCYSFWMGGLFPILDAIASRSDGNPGWPNDSAAFKNLMNRDALQEYVLICCQAPKGGLRDKPGKHPDYYHSCYCLSGLSIAQHNYSWSLELQDFVLSPNTLIVGDATNELPATHPVHNIRMEYVDRIRSYFQ
ncbi:terpenoid cyclases/protein prenyltransferase alpha-alpha toroid [Obelidium mucronatum]|nr:terpenoid cyclases/protein prenyltransferase alpha-alpha toroid [Obelidium mucronatum]